MKLATLAYLAGFIDADGSITIIKVKPNPWSARYVTKLSAHNCRIEPIKLLQKHFGGGKLRFKKTGKARKMKNWRPCYEWVITASRANAALAKLLPYLLIKKKQAELCMQLQVLKHLETGAFKRWNPKLSSLRFSQYETLKLKCNKLNIRGVQNASNKSSK